MALTQKETMFLKDLKKAEQTCVDRYTRFASEASDGTLKNLFQTILKTEQQHLQTITQLIDGMIPQMSGGGSAKKTEPASQADPNMSKEDKFLCDDALDSEKFASSLYNTSVFEFQNSEIRNILNHIQKEEQEHGEMLFDYMKPRGMYAVG